MAIFNEILAPRYAKMIAKLFSMKGANPTKQLAGEVSVALPLFLGAEARWLEGWDTFGVGAVVAAVAANASGFRLRNPAGSKVVAVITKLVASEPSNDVIIQRHGTIPPTPDLPTPVALSGNNFDIRTNRSPTLIASLSNGTPGVPALASPGFTADQTSVLAQTPYYFIITDNQEFPLLPGYALQMEANTVNVALRVAIMWRERSLEDSELF